MGKQQPKHKDRFDLPLRFSLTDLRIRSPRELFWTLHTFLEDRGYKHQYKVLEPKEAPIEGTSIFEGSLIGRNESPKKCPLWKWLLGVLLCLTIILIPVAISLLRKWTTRVEEEFNLEGETYRAKGVQTLATTEKEVYHVVSDVRISLTFNIYEFRQDRNREIKRLIKDNQVINVTLNEYGNLRHQVESIIPKIKLPIIETGSQ